MSTKNEVMMTMNSSGGHIHFENTDGMRELFEHYPIDTVLNYHGIPKVWKNSCVKYYGYPIENYPQHVKVLDQYFEDMMNPFQGGYVEAKKFYLLRKQNEGLSNDKGFNEGIIGGETSGTDGSGETSGTEASGTGKEETSGVLQQLNNDKGLDIRKDSTNGAETAGVGQHGNAGAGNTGDLGAEDTSTPPDEAFKSKMTAKRRGRVKGRRKSK